MSANKVLTARAWGSHDFLGGLQPFARPVKWSTPGLSTPVVIVHGLSKSEVHEAAELLAKSREVCEWTRFRGIDTSPIHTDTGKKIEHIGGSTPTFCPSCGRRVVVKEG